MGSSPTADGRVGNFAGAVVVSRPIVGRLEPAEAREVADALRAQACAAEGGSPSCREEFERWFREGLRREWVVEAFCATHDQPPRTAEEKAAAGGDEDVLLDRCAPALRVLFP